MKKVIRILGFLVLFLILAAAGGLLYFNSAYPVKIKIDDIKVEATPERLERGKYLAHHVSLCIDCHSARDFKYYSGPLIENTFGQGGEEFNKEIGGIPGLLYARNITPAGIGHWSDGELLRAITCGVNKENEALFPLMPYQNYASLSKEDLFSIVAYIRSLPPIENDITEKSIDFPVNLIIKTLPAEASLTSTIPDKSNKLEYGKYMTNAAGCVHCHTKQVEGKFVEGMAFAGGFRFGFPDGSVIQSANITPDKETGIGHWTREAFIARFKAYVDSLGNPVKIPVVPNEKNTIMPWTVYGGMTTEDLGAIYDFLRTVPAINHKVITFTPAGENLAGAH